MPAPELGEWARESFLDPGGPLYSADHAHLESASVLWLWAYPENKKNGRTVLGDCSIPRPPSTGGAWGRAAYWQQIEDWSSGERPDFMIRISAPYFADCDDLSACALTEHELYHAGILLDENGDPKFSRETGLPIWGIKGHDIEEHLGVVRRYGAASPDLAQLADALKHPPSVGRAAIAKSCGTCRLTA